MKAKQIDPKKLPANINDLSPREQVRAFSKAIPKKIVREGIKRFNDAAEQIDNTKGEGKVPTSAGRDDEIKQLSGDQAEGYDRKGDRPSDTPEATSAKSIDPYSVNLKEMMAQQVKEEKEYKARRDASAQMNSAVGDEDEDLDDDGDDDPDPEAAEKPVAEVTTLLLLLLLLLLVC